MSTRIIFCKHAVETLTYFSSQLAEAFASFGYEIFWMDFDMLGLSAWKLRQALQGEKHEHTVLFTFNFIGLSWEEELWDLNEDGIGEISLWEKLGIRCFNMIVDHPIYYYKILQRIVPGMQMFCIDRDHVAYMRRFYPHIACEFLPTAGNQWIGSGCTEVRGQAEELFAQWVNRPYPLVFTANYVPLTNIKKQLDGLDRVYRDFYYELIEAFITQPQKDLLSLIEFYLRREDADLTDLDLLEAMNTMQAVDLWIRTYFREKAVRMLAEDGIPIHVVGQDWEQVSWKRPKNMTISGKAVDSADCIRIMSQAKIALNTMPWFKDGAHDRIFTAMLQGSVPLTDDSKYLREHFQDGDTLVYYDLHKLEKLPDIVRGLLADPVQMYAITRRAKVLAEQSHTWKQRARELLIWIEP